MGISGIPVIDGMLKVSGLLKTGYGGKFTPQFKITELANGRALKLTLTHEPKTPLKQEDIRWIKKKFLKNNRTVHFSSTGSKITVIGFTHHTDLPTQLSEKIRGARLGTILKPNQVTRMIEQRKR